MIACATAAAQPSLRPADHIESISAWNWALFVLYSFAGWVMAHLKTAVAFASGSAETKASIISDLVASFATGVGIAAFIYLEYVIDPAHTVSPVAAYFGAAVGAYGGKKILDAAVEGLQAVARNFLNKGGKDK